MYFLKKVLFRRTPEKSSTHRRNSYITTVEENVRKKRNCVAALNSNKKKKNRILYTNTRPFWKNRRMLSRSSVMIDIRRNAHYADTTPTVLVFASRRRLVYNSDFARLITRAVLTRRRPKHTWWIAFRAYPAPSRTLLYPMPRDGDSRRPVEIINILIGAGRRLKVADLFHV